MGCSSCRPKWKKQFYQDKVSDEPILTSIENLDNLLTELKPLLSNIERLRENFAKSWIDVQNYFGAYVLDEKSIRTVLICSLYRLSSELSKETIETMSMHTQDPWFVFDKRYEYLLTKDAKGHLKKIKDFLTLSDSIRSEFDDVCKNYKEKQKAVKEEIEKVDLEKFNLEEKEKMTSVLDKNEELLDHAYRVISFFNNILSKYDSDLESVVSDFKNKGLVNDMVRISTDYGSMKFYNSRTIVLKYSKEKKAINN